MINEPGAARKERNDALRSLLRLIEAHHPGEEAHAQRVAVYAVAIGHKMNLEEKDLMTLKEAALLHDVGKLGVDKGLLGKEAEYTEEDRIAVRMHSMLFSRAPIPSFLEPCGLIVRHHHERWDGQGYPDRLEGDQIPLGSRIIAVAESFDAMAHGAGWRQRLEEDKAVAEIESESGGQFDPAVVSAFLSIQPLIQPLI